MTAEEYMKERVEDQIGYYDSKAANSQRSFKRLRLAEIVIAAAIPVLAGFGGTSELVPLTLGALGAGVAVIAGVLGLYQFERNWVEYRSTCEALKRERFLFLTGSEPFNVGEQERSDLLVQRVEALLAQEQAGWMQAMASRPEQGGAAAATPDA